MTKSYTELSKESIKFIEFLSQQGINATLKEDTFRDYNVKINVLGVSIILYHKPSKKTFSIGTHEISDPKMIEQVQDLWHHYQCPKSCSIKGLCAYVDGSFYKGQIGWGVVLVENNVVLKEMCGIVNLTPEEGSRQIAGEIQAVLETLEYCTEHKQTSVTIFYDYIGLQKWATHEWKSNSAIAQFYVAKLMQYRISISWEKVKAHTGNRFNEMVDKLAKSKIL